MNEYDFIKALRLSGFIVEKGQPKYINSPIVLQITKDDVSLRRFELDITNFPPNSFLELIKRIEEAFA